MGSGKQKILKERVYKAFKEALDNIDHQDNIDSINRISDSWIDYAVSPKIPHNLPDTSLKFATSLQTPKEYYLGKERLLGQYFAPVIEDAIYHRLVNLLNSLSHHDKDKHLNLGFLSLIEKLEKEQKMLDFEISKEASLDWRSAFGG